MAVDEEAYATIVPITQPKRRWFTIEYVCYMSVLIGGGICFVYNGFKTSQRLAPELHNLPGWFFGRQIDLADFQYGNTHKSIFAMGMLCMVYLLLKHGSIFLLRWMEAVLRQLLGLISKSNAIAPMKKNLGAPMKKPSAFKITDNLSMSVAANLIFYCCWGLLAQYIFHNRLGIFWLNLIFALNYVLAMLFRGSYMNPITTWLLQVVLVFFRGIWSTPWFFQLIFGENAFTSWILADNSQMYGFGEVINLLSLRMISFNMDYYYKCRGADIRNTKGRTAYFLRAETPLPWFCYSPLQYLAFVTYFPTYVAGPIMSYNAFVSQIHFPPPAEPSIHKMLYFFRFLFFFLFNEIMLQYIYFNAIYLQGHMDALAGWEVLLMITFLGTAKYMLYYVVWRMYRTVALFDNMEVPENMTRCIYNNHTFVSFWRSWHSSYNLWIVRNLYIPLGGRKNLAINVAIVFAYVGMWHSSSWPFLLWGILNCVFFVHEAVWIGISSQEKYNWIWNAWWSRHLLALCGTINLWFLLFANLPIIIHGFLPTVKVFRLMLFSEVQQDLYFPPIPMPGWLFTLLFSGWLMALVLFQLEYKNEEERYLGAKKKV